ncbi:oxidoreductase [Marinithermofilum abyssi]|uniref:Oxidoreductase n=1 Tax=Marinithermofilum abyssi TaxID=1571185 RepID=A0A8J2VJI4_9BACL|nr:oxidoreductase [Marinithermofilum abyssi]GGE25784.1 oxidoreductase [Marinithermofilum abyssi]
MSIRVGLVGYGLSGAVFHAPLIESVEGLKLVSVVSSRPEAVHRDYPGVSVFPALDQMLENGEEIDLVVIATPNTSHYEYAKQALTKGKHVVVEKPFTITTREAEELIELARENDVLLSVYQNRRWDNDFLTVRSLLEEGLLGELAVYEAHYDRYRPQVRDRWREREGEGSGMLYDLGSHLIDQALFLFGRPQAVTADLGAQRKKGTVVDYFHLNLDYGTLKVILHSGSLVKKQGPRFQLHGEKGSFIKYGLDPQENQLKQGKRPGDEGYGEDTEDQYGQLALELNGLCVDGKVPTLPGRYQSFYEGIYQSIVSGQVPPVTAEEARDTIRVIELAMQSHEEKRTIPWE